MGEKFDLTRCGLAGEVVWAVLAARFPFCASGRYEPELSTSSKAFSSCSSSPHSIIEWILGNLEAIQLQKHQIKSELKVQQKERVPSRFDTRLWLYGSHGRMQSESFQIQMRSLELLI